ncbi:hypothetical protein AA313_de0203960 [Arthrobotrys entomopaga]|nr:hypothetical protein AA313_de0203960 [Arthrobotrys entomopaga]
MTTQTHTALPHRMSLRSSPDLAIKCHNRVFKIHEDQILENSTLLRNVQYHGVQNGIRTVEIKVIGPQTISCLLDFIYTGDFDETGTNSYIPSSCGDANCKDHLDLGSPSSDLYRKLAIVDVCGETFKISGLRELVEKKLISNGLNLEGLDKTIGELASDMTQILQRKMRLSKPSCESTTPTISDTVTPPKQETSLDQQNHLAIQNTTATSTLATKKVGSNGLQAEHDALRADYEGKLKELKEQKEKFLVMQAEKLQADLCRDTAQERLDGLIKALNETKRCKNSGCQVSLNVLVQENEVRTKGNVKIRCGTCNARQG